MTESESQSAAEKAPLIGIATRILMARRGCPRDEAYALLNEAAKEHYMPVRDMAPCLVANREIR